MTPAPADYEILLRVSHLVRLFHTLDPSPFRERDLDAEALDFILDWAKEAPRDVPFAIVVELPESERSEATPRILEEAIANNFDYLADWATRQLRELFREGRLALLIGIPILAACLVGSQLVRHMAGPGTLAEVVGESLLILGWVANWQPLEIFLYGWWPILRRRALYRRLAAARVEVRSSESSSAAASFLAV